MERTEALLREQAYATRIQQLLCALIARAKDDESAHDGTIRMLLSDAWEELRLRPTAMSVQDLDTLGNEVHRFELRKDFLRNRAAQSQQMLKQPYFARVDFHEDGQDAPESLYIGLYSLLDEGGRSLVCDWRAPAADLYYDAMPGRCGYQSPGGPIEGNMLLKRQYRFEDGVLRYYVDTDLAIEDGMLMDILKNATSHRMRSIVSTIQSEQNRAIRAEAGGVVCVTGGAGSGKTSVAMHRAAYLMYRHRSSLGADSIVALSPTSAFSEYISGVLPELGEDNARMPVLRQLYTKLIGIAPEPPLRQAERLSQPSYTLRRESVGIKSGRAFVALMDKFVALFEAEGPSFADIAVDGRAVVTAAQMRDLYRREFRGLNPCLRLTRIRAVLLQRLERFGATLKPQYLQALKGQHRGRDLELAASGAVLEALAPAKGAAKKMTSTDPLMLYAEALKELPEALAVAAWENAGARLIWWEDAPAIGYMMLALGFASPERGIKQLLVDEVQDYPLIALGFLRRLYPQADVTLLGDPNQRTGPGMPECVPEEWGGCFGAEGTELIALTKCYRSTAPITRLCNALLPEASHALACGREGEPPLLRTYLPDALVGLIERWTSEGKRVAVITRALPEAIQLAKLVPGAWLIEGEDDMMPEAGGVVFSCYHLLKGLEFDAVAVVWPDVELTLGERRRLYTACSRALHHLALMGEHGLIRALDIVV